MKLSELTSNARWDVRAHWRRGCGCVMAMPGRGKGYKVTALGPGRMAWEVRVMKLKGWEVVERDTHVH